MNYSKERNWIRKKIDSGVPQNLLSSCVADFSCKAKKKVMEQKNITEKEYEKRWNFLANVYYLLSNEKFEKKVR